MEQRPTSHLDLSGSLLELLGADPAQRSGYTLGESLFAPPVARDRVIGGFYHLGVWTDLGIFNLPLEPEGDVLGVYDESWNLHADVRGRLERARPRLQVIADQCHQFLDHE